MSKTLGGALKKYKVCDPKKVTWINCTPSPPNTIAIALATSDTARRIALDRSALGAVPLFNNTSMTKQGIPTTPNNDRASW
jgi:hypothetical protein